MQNLVNLLNSAGLFNTMLIVLSVIGGYFAIRNGKRAELSKFQKDTIEAREQRIQALEERIVDLDKTNSIQQHIIDTIIAALKQRGMVITIDGDMVTIADHMGNTTSRKRTTTTTRGIVVKEEKGES